MDDFLFNIPIYLRSGEEYENERIETENKEKESWGGEYAFDKKIQVKWPPWEYNDIIGYYKIIINSSANPGSSINGIRVEKYTAINKRINRNPNPRKISIFLNDPWFHKKLSTFFDQKNDFKNTLLKVLDNLYDDATKAKRKTKRYYIDIEYYKNLIECIDFNKYKNL